MRKLVFAVSLLFALSVLFCSCNKNNIEVPHNDKFIVGSWVELYPVDNNKVWEYEEFTADGKYKYYELTPYDDNVYATYENGTLTTPAGATWEMTDLAAYVFSYSPSVISVEGHSVSISIVDDNTISNYSHGEKSYFHRITKFK